MYKALHCLLSSASSHSVYAAATMTVRPRACLRKWIWRSTQRHPIPAVKQAVAVRLEPVVKQVTAARQVQRARRARVAWPENPVTAHSLAYGKPSVRVARPFVPEGTSIGFTGGRVTQKR